MIHRTPQRSYTPQSVEAWFSRLSQDWERYFSEEELRWGRSFYRSGEVRSTELLESSAIIHFKRGKEPLYIIVDWETQEPSFRLSHPDFAPGLGLAVAGMYELEEFVADEVPAITDLDNLERRGEATREIEQPAEPTERTGRRLRVLLSGKPDGLWLEVGWQKDEEAINWKHFTLRELTRWEREQLIGYTARAHRCGFKTGDREGSYRLQNPTAIDRFFRKELNDWKRLHGLKEGSGIGAWKQGIQLVRPVIDVHQDGLHGRYRFSFAGKGPALDDSIRDNLFRHPGHTHFVPGKGIFKVDEKALDVVHEWKSLLTSEGEGVLPRYLLFNLAQNPHVLLTLSNEICAWRRRLESVAMQPEADAFLPILRDYQRNGVSWLMKLDALGCHSLLADEMGLGKTLQVLSFLDMQEALGRKPVLVVCPASVVPVWQAEVERYFPGTRICVLSRKEPFNTEIPALWISSYTQLRRNKHLLAENEFAYAILDEAQSIKNPDAKVTQACFAIRSRQRIALSGTPVENRPLDLWTLFRFLMPGFLGTRRHFEERVRRDPEYTSRLREQIAPFVLRRTKSSVATELPDKVEIDWICSLTPVQRRYYKGLTEGASHEFTGAFAQVIREKRMHLFGLLTRLRQVCCDPGLLPGHKDHYSHSGKLQSLVNLLEEALSNGSKVVVFSQFVKFLHRARTVIRQEFPKVPLMELTGSTLDRLKPVKCFSETDGPAVFLISLRAGGTGLNLQSADYVFLLDPWWNPAVEDQAIDRVHRIGQKNQVMVYRMITKGTIEERIGLLKQQKSQLFDELLSDMDAPADLLQQFDSLEALIRLEGDEDPE